MDDKDIDKIYTGDALSVLREQPSDSIDLIVTDPPYQLSSIAQRFNTETDSRNGIRRQGKRWDGKPPDLFYRVSKGFMGKEWDVIPEVETWKECLRVLKPGAFAFILCTPRQDSLCLMISRLTEAGFDMGFTSLYWTYATGFPKGTSISKQVDKRLGAEREVIGQKIGKGGENLNILARESKGDSENAKGCGAYGCGAKQININIEITAPATVQAKTLDGSYTFNPKPAVEVILVCQKPMTEKTYVGQALAWYEEQQNVLKDIGNELKAKYKLDKVEWANE